MLSCEQEEEEEEEEEAPPQRRQVLPILALLVQKYKYWLHGAAAAADRVQRETPKEYADVC